MNVDDPQTRNGTQSYSLKPLKVVSLSTKPVVAVDDEATDASAQLENVSLGSLTELIRSIGLPASAADLPEFSNEEFVEWMQNFIENASQTTPEEEEEAASYMARQIATKAGRPRTGLVGLGRADSSKALTRRRPSAGSTSALNVSGSTFRDFKFRPRPAQSQSLPEIQFSQGTGVKLTRSEDGQHYTYSYYDQVRFCPTAASRTPHPAHRRRTTHGSSLAGSAGELKRRTLDQGPEQGLPGGGGGTLELARSRTVAANHGDRGHVGE